MKIVGFLRNLFREKELYENIDYSVDIGNNVKTGTWTEIRKGAKIGNNVVLGNWVKIGENAVIMDNCILPDHVRVMPNVTVAEGMVLEGHELISHFGIHPKICSGSFTKEFSRDGEDMVEMHCIAGYFEATGYFEDMKSMHEDYMWGICDRLLQYKC